MGPTKTAPALVQHSIHGTGHARSMSFAQVHEACKRAGFRLLHASQHINDESISMQALASAWGSSSTMGTAMTYTGENASTRPEPALAAPSFPEYHTSHPNCLLIPSWGAA